jgi:hypothetical protein
VQIFDLFFVNLRRFAVAAFKDTRGTLEQCAFPLVDIVGCTLNRLANSLAVFSPFSASNATFALNSG